MSWIQKLHETYELCAGLPQFSSNPLLPISHTTQQAHIEIVIDGSGNFRRASVVSKEDQTTLIPCTEESGGRAGSKPKNHPLCDKLQYVAGDYRELGGEVTVGFTKEEEEPHRSYLKDLEAWGASPDGHRKLAAILTYVRKKHVVHDLVRERLLPLDSQGKLLKKWDGDKKDVPAIFKVIPAGSSPEDAFIRWHVEIANDPEPAIWKDKEIMDAWIRYYASQQTKHGLCMVTGNETILAEQHPAKLRNAGDKAKLISSNDTSGYTFRGRFIDAVQACGVGFVVTQQAHKALQWLLDFERRQAFRNGNQVIVAWAVSGKSLPDLFNNSAQMFGLESREEDAAPVYQGDAGQAFAVRLKKYIAGYRTRLGSTDAIVVMALDSATPGRMAITYYRELTGSEFLERVQLWHESCAWHQNFGKSLKFVGVPSPRDITEAAYGRQVEGKSGEKLRKATVERLLPCIIDGRPIPRDIVESAVRRAVNRSGLEKWEWEKNLGIACALFRGHHQQRSYEMALELDRTSRDYLFGRLLAVAERIEDMALYLAKENRGTSAAKLMQRFADHPYSTWRTIELSLAPYKTRLRTRSPGFLVNMEKLLDGIICTFRGQDFTSESRLSGEFLLGYHCQRQALWPKSESTNAEETTETQTDQGE
ncbi:MAG: type I-C CRISPR-associated protein Cas8c/Csd1 [Nitrospira sp. CG24D]|nr:MAG: type I-C CRISPR-associated protein Cas8c/Csd1 [Nitrospira sp. CG24D]